MQIDPQYPPILNRIKQMVNQKMWCKQGEAVGKAPLITAVVNEP